MCAGRSGAWLAPLFVFVGTLFVCDAACNALGRPHYATALNWGRATLGTVPFIMLGSYWGAQGVLLGHMAGGIAFGLAAIVVVQRLIARLETARPHAWSAGRYSKPPDCEPA
jgi:Na+-driven multidrug efflux pump